MHQTHKAPSHIRYAQAFNPFKPSDVKWLHFPVFKAIVV